MVIEVSSELIQMRSCLPFASLGSSRAGVWLGTRGCSIYNLCSTNKFTIGRTWQPSQGRQLLPQKRRPSLLHLKGVLVAWFGQPPLQIIVPLELDPSGATDRAVAETPWLWGILPEFVPQKAFALPDPRRGYGPQVLSRVAMLPEGA